MPFSLVPQPGPSPTDFLRELLGPLEPDRAEALRGQLQSSPPEFLQDLSNRWFWAKDPQQMLEYSADPTKSAREFERWLGQALRPRAHSLPWPYDTFGPQDNVMRDTPAPFSLLPPTGPRPGPSERGL